MKRWTFRIVLCLLLGVVTTVGVAWTFALFLQPMEGSPSHQGISSQTYPRWQTAMYAMLGARQVFTKHDFSPAEYWDATLIVSQALFPEWSRASVAVPDHLPLWNQILIEDGRGLPFLCLESETGVILHSPPGVPPYYSPETTRWGIRIGSVDELDPYCLLEYRVLPLRPIWRGLMFNTFFYGIGWFITIYGLSAVMRALIRRNRYESGLCPSCGFDLRSDLDRGCPECGWNRESEPRP